MIDPRMLEFAVNATIRVREEIKGIKSVMESAIEYGLLGDMGFGRQYLMMPPLLAANAFHGPPFAEIKSYDLNNDSR